MKSSENYYVISHDMEIYSEWDQVIVLNGDIIELPPGHKLPYHHYIAEASNLDRLMIIGKKKKIFKIIPPIKFLKITYKSDE